MTKKMKSKAAKKKYGVSVNYWVKAYFEIEAYNLDHAHEIVFDDYDFCSGITKVDDIRLTDVSEVSA